MVTVTENVRLGFSKRQKETKNNQSLFCEHKGSNICNITFSRVINISSEQSNIKQRTVKGHEHYHYRV